jgi:hypothetical protein
MGPIAGAVYGTGFDNNDSEAFEESEINFEVYISPDDSTFAIWGLIYSLLIFFTIYEVIPDDYVTERNNDFFFKEIGWLWGINMTACIFWWFTFLAPSNFGIVTSVFFISTMLGTALVMSKKAHSAELNWVEWVSFSVGMSLYSGWLSTATILNVSGMLKRTNLADGWNEPLITVIMLWVAASIYIGNSFLNGDPIYASVFIWACAGIRRDQEGKNELVESNLDVLIILMSAWVGGLTIYENFFNA